MGKAAAHGTLPAMTRVLVVEDDAAIGRLIRRSLSDAGNAVALAADGATGLALALSEQPDVVLLDLGLPDLDGRQVLRMLRAVSGVPVIVITAQDDDRTVVDALDRLRAKGLVVSRQGSGHYVHRSSTTLPANAGPDLLPQDTLSVVRRAVLLDNGALRPGAGFLPSSWLPAEASAGSNQRWSVARGSRTARRSSSASASKSEN